MKSYKSWSPEYRKESLALTNKAKQLGWISSPKKCNRCGQTDGILHLHNEDYDVTHKTLSEVFKREPLWISEDEITQVNGVLEPLCWRCHMMHHSVRRNATSVEKYFHEINEGKIYPPVFKHDFEILKRDHDIP